MERQWLLYAIIFCSRLGFQATQPMVPLHMAELGATPSSIGLLLGAAGILPVAMASVLGRLGDHTGPFWQVLGGGILNVLGFWAIGLAESLWLVTVYLAIASVGAFATNLAYQSFIADTSTSENRAQAFAWLAAAVSLANSLAPAGAGLLAHWFNFATVFYAAAIASGISLVGLPWLRNKPNDKNNSSSTGTEKDTESWLQNRTLLFAMGATLLTGLIVSMRNSFLPLYLEDTGHSVAQVGILLSVQAVASFLIQTRMGKMTTRYGAVRLIIISFVMLTPALFLTPLASSIVTLSLLMILLGLCSGILHPITMSMVAGSVPTERQGTALGFRYSALRLGNIANPFLFGFIAGIGGLPATLLTAGGISGVAAVSGWFVALRASIGDVRSPPPPATDGTGPSTDGTELRKANVAKPESSEALNK